MERRSTNVKPANNGPLGPPWPGLSKPVRKEAAAAAAPAAGLAHPERRPRVGRSSTATSQRPMGCWTTRVRGRAGGQAQRGGGAGAGAPVCPSREIKHATDRRACCCCRLGSPQRERLLASFGSPGLRLRKRRRLACPCPTSEAPLRGRTGPGSPFFLPSVRPSVPGAAAASLAGSGETDRCASEAAPPAETPGSAQVGFRRKGGGGGVVSLASALPPPRPRVASVSSRGPVGSWKEGRVHHPAGRRNSARAQKGCGEGRGPHLRGRPGRAACFLP